MTNKSKYSQEELEEFKTLLLSKKEKTELQIEKFQQRLDDITGNGRDEHGLGNSSQESLIEQLFEYKQRGVKHLRDINNALLRIKNNVYGVCSVTGKKIDRKRLLAVPTTTKSIEGKMKSE